MALALLAIVVALTAPPGLPRFFFERQDSLVVVGLIGLLIAGAFSSRTDEPWTEPDPWLSRWRVAGISIAAALMLWGGAYLLLDDYPLTRDEHMVVFDMAVFRSGHLAYPLAIGWRPYAQALTPAFLLPLPGNAAWVSSYMPVNAMLHAAFGAVFDPALLNPLLAALGAIALFDIAQRLFPDRRSAQLIALMLYGTSAQVLVSAMTPYAMTGHLALNLAWLALYLRGTRSSHAVAMGVGFLAIGLHQIVFHPLFAAPFIDQLRRRGEWRTAAAYLASYAVFLLFWVSYPHLVSASAGLEAVAGPESGSAGFVTSRVLPLLINRNPDTLQLMAANILRFLSWENLALVPMMALAISAIRRNEGIARPLLNGIVLTTLAMAFLLPYQGHGWGYRYLHGLIGNCALLAAYGWRDFSDRTALRGFIRIGTIATVCGSIPFLLWQAHSFVEPYAQLNRAIDHTNADIVVVNTEGTGFVADEVRNQPDLSNRPIRLASATLTPADIRTFCARGTIAFVGASQMRLQGLVPMDALDSKHFSNLGATAKSCGGGQARL